MFPQQPYVNQQGEMGYDADPYAPGYAGDAGDAHPDPLDDVYDAYGYDRDLAPVDPMGRGRPGLAINRAERGGVPQPQRGGGRGQPISEPSVPIQVILVVGGGMGSTPRADKKTSDLSCEILYSGAC